MIISRTPFRVSFFGGGTDYPAWFSKHGGAVLATTIDKYCYINCRYLPPFFDHKYRLIYSKSENCQSIDEIAHPSAREVLRFMKMDRGVEIHHDADLPARSGMGSSSAFTVGLLNALYALTGRMPNKEKLAKESIYIEQEMIRETVGSQDQILAAYGGFNHILFFENGDFSVRPVTLTKERIGELNQHLMLFFTGVKRTASSIAESFIDRMEDNKRQLRIMKDLVDEGISILSSDQSILGFGELLHEAWLAKRSLSSKVSNPIVDEIYAEALKAGAIGGKITGAGGGGFFLLFVPPEKQEAVRSQLNFLIQVPFKFSYSGSQIIYFEPEEDFIELEKQRENLPLRAFRDASELKS
ncbi:MAG TPA: GHMP kinase [Anaerolineaceae bacterium]